MVEHIKSSTIKKIIKTFKTNILSTNFNEEEETSYQIILLEKLQKI